MEYKNKTSINDDDEMIDMENYTRDTRELVLSDHCVQDILSEIAFGGYNQKRLSDAFKHLKSNNFPEFKKVVSKNKDIINIKFHRSYMIHEACRQGNPECVSFLLFMGAACSVMDDDGYTAQHRAVISKSTIIVDILSLFGNSMNVKDKFGYTPFYYALLQKDDEMVKTLMAYKAEPIIKKITEENTLESFLNACSADMSEMLKKYVDEF